MGLVFSLYVSVLKSKHKLPQTHLVQCHTRVRFCRKSQQTFYALLFPAEFPLINAHKLSPIWCTESVWQDSHFLCGWHKAGNSGFSDLCMHRRVKNLNPFSQNMVFVPLFPPIFTVAAPTNSLFSVLYFTFWTLRRIGQYFISYTSLECTQLNFWQHWSPVCDPRLKVWTPLC